MTEAVEYRLASLKTFVGWSVALLALLTALVLVALEWYLGGIVVYGMALLMGSAARGRETDGYARSLWEALPGKEYGDRPTKEWKNDLEERGEL